MASLSRFLEGRLRLKVNLSKSVVDRPWNCTFLGYTVTNHLMPRLKPAPSPSNGRRTGFVRSPIGDVDGTSRGDCGNQSLHRGDGSATFVYRV